MAESIDLATQALKPCTSQHLKRIIHRTQLFIIVFIMAAISRPWKLKNILNSKVQYRGGVPTSRPPLKSPSTPPAGCKSLTPFFQKVVFNKT